MSPPPATADFDGHARETRAALFGPREDSAKEFSPLRGRRTPFPLQSIRSSRTASSERALAQARPLYRGSVRIRAFNPLERVGPPALLAVALGVVAISGGHHLWPVAIVPGVILSVLGVRIAYGRGLTRDAERLKNTTPWNAWLPLWYYRQVSGAVICIFGLFFLGLAADGLAKITA